MDTITPTLVPNTQFCVHKECARNWTRLAIAIVAPVAGMCTHVPDATFVCLCCERIILGLIAVCMLDTYSVQFIRVSRLRHSLTIAPFTRGL